MHLMLYFVTCNFMFKNFRNKSVRYLCFKLGQIKFVFEYVFTLQIASGGGGTWGTTFGGGHVPPGHPLATPLGIRPIEEREKRGICVSFFVMKIGLASDMYMKHRIYSDFHKPRNCHLNLLFGIFSWFPCKQLVIVCACNVNFPNSVVLICYISETVKVYR